MAATTTSILPTQPAEELVQTSADSFLLNLLLQRIERKDTRVFAHAAAETQSAIAQSSRPVTRAGHQGPTHTSAGSHQPGFLEVFPKVSSRPPRLLQELESILVDRLRCADKAAWPGIVLPKDRDPGLAGNLSLDAHRQVFAAFIEGFSTYRTLLAQIQSEFETALAEGLRCTQENVELRKRMAQEAQKRLHAQQDVRSKIMAEEVGFRRAAFSKLQETRERTARLTRRAAAAERDLAAAREEEGRLLKLVTSLRGTYAALQETARGEKTWTEQPTSEAMRQKSIGPLSEQDKQFLDSEYQPAALQRPS